MTEPLVYLPGILTAYTVFFIGLASPGPNVLAVIGTSMSVSRRAGVALATGVAFGSFTWAILTVIGLSALLSAYAWALMAIKIFGGVYLLWLAYKSFRAAASELDIHDRALTGVGSTLRYAVRGYAIQMTNPKAALTWIAIISLGLREGAPVWVGAVIVVGTFALSLVIHILYAVGFSTPPMLRFYARARRYIQATLGAFFAFAGLKLLMSRT